VNGEQRSNFICGLVGFGGYPVSVFRAEIEIYFDVTDGRVVVSRIEPYNNCPHMKYWAIPLDEWRAIIKFVERKA
jgi:hypothetical protein